MNKSHSGLCLQPLNLQLHANQIVATHPTKTLSKSFNLTVSNNFVVHSALIQVIYEAVVEFIAIYIVFAADERIGFVDKLFIEGNNWYQSTHRRQIG